MAEQRRRRSDRQARSEAAAATSDVRRGNADPTHDDIALRAYQRYQNRGGQHGSDWADWFEAERELRSGRSGDQSS
jgi:hypothetical protein